jgi:HJR/Mrr/RecB family endonuclease
MAQLKAELQQIKPSSAEISFEAICERLLLSKGYRVTARNQYGSVGGDVDLRCVRERSDASPFETGQTLLFVQVKKHVGTTDEWAVNQLLKMITQEPLADGCVMSLGDSFTEAAQDLAEKNGILLMNGDTVCRLLLEEITGSQDT